MKLVIDLQGAQSSGSRFRGIGRYSVAFAQELIRQAGDHQVSIALNGLFPDSIDPLRLAFDGLIPPDRISVWTPPGPVAQMTPTNEWRRQVAEYLRESYLGSQAPDIVHCSSLFEGFSDNTVTSISTIESIPTAVTLYDLIPYVFRQIYLTDPNAAAWYDRKIEHLKQAQLWLAISDASRRDGITHLGLPERWVHNISTAADDMFRPLAMSPAEEAAIRRRHGLTRPFLMYTGGIDHRKNIEGLIAAYAKLPSRIRASHQLTIVCAATDIQTEVLRAFAKKRGLLHGDIVFTGFIPDADMVALYNLCKGFIFPSWYEGFGLPVLEAMKCGAAVIGSNCSSIPEVIGRVDALFDANSTEDMTAHIHHLLTDDAFREDLRQSGLVRSKLFSWDNTARRAWDAYEALHDHQTERRRLPSAALPADQRPRLAYISPLPPLRSGIADYSADLLPELAKFYRIDVVTDQPAISDPWIAAHCPQRSVAQFEAEAGDYDRILYHLGNSEFHQHMFPLLTRHPGTVVLHDFFLSGILHWADVTGCAPDCFTEALYAAHGYHAVRDRLTDSADVANIIYRYPTNLAVLQQANGIILHSRFSYELARRWYQIDGRPPQWCHIPLLLAGRTDRDRAAARSALGLRDADFLVCSFGILAATKLNQRLLDAWLASPMAQDPQCHLVFVGVCNETDPHNRALQAAIAASGYGDRIRITGFAEPALYQRYLAAADTAVQLRTLSRGETSRAVLECIESGVPTIFNAHGALEEIPASFGLRLPGSFSDEALQSALVKLWKHPEQRQALAQQAQRDVRALHHPESIGQDYAAAIERFAESGPHQRIERLIGRISELPNPPDDEWSWFAVAESMATSFPPLRARTVFLDITAQMHGHASTLVSRALFDDLPPATRIEPVYADEDGILRYARRFVFEQLLDRPLPEPLPALFEDLPVDGQNGDLYLCLEQPPVAPDTLSPALQQLRQRGVGLYFASSALGHDNVGWRQFLRQSAHGVMCRSRSAADDFAKWMRGQTDLEERRFTIGYVSPDLDGAPTAAEPFLRLLLTQGWQITLPDPMSFDLDVKPIHQRA